jgi:restriction endonuclease S subunit
MSITRYEAYKDSGVEWLGEVPAHWALNRHKDVFSFISDRCINLLLLKVGLENIEGKTGRFITTESEFEGDGVEFIKNDILFGKLRPYLAKVYLADFNGNAVGDIFVYRPKQNVTPIFAQYLMLSDGYIDVINSSTAGAKMPRVSSNFIANLPVSTPPITEQFAITNYLDTKTAQIDRKLDFLSQKAAQYGKLKQSLINETVTRGLDKTVAMKDSGVEWIGEVPAHWLLNRHKDNFSFVAGRCTNSSLTKVGLENIEGKTGRFISTDTQFDGDGVEFKKNDILFGKLRPYLAKVYLSEFNGNAVGDIFVYRPTRNTKPKFALYLMLSDKYIDVINSSTAGAKMPRVGSNFIANLPVSIPSKQEQQAIANYLDDKTAHIDRIVSTINTQIDKLKELRKALINDVVTGKICVLSESVQEL